MRSKWSFLIKLYVTLLALNTLQKPLFMWMNAPENSNYAWGDYWDVIANGLLLDIPVCGYFTALPLLFTIGCLFLNREVNVRRIATPYYIFIAFLMCLLFVADLSLYPFWKFKLDATIFYYIDSPKDAMASVSTGYIIWRILWILTLSGIEVWLLRAITPKLWVKDTHFGKKEVLTNTLLTLLIVPLFVISIRGGIGKSTANIGRVYFSEDEFLNHSAVNPLFSLIYSLDKAENYEEEYKYFNEEERTRIFEGLYPATPVETDTLSLLTTTRPNIIIILLEGMGGVFTRDSIITPYYNRFSKEGILFTNCYSNSYRTDRGMVSTLSGHLAYPSVSIMKLPIKSRTLPCISNSLNDAGYVSSFLYGGDINFTNMQSYLRTGGYDPIVSETDFSSQERETGDWGANDEITFNRLYDMVKSQQHTPWHIGYLTLSSHEPWDVPTHRLKEKKPNAFAFTDACLGAFVEKMKQTDLWKDLLIVCIPDHGVSYPNNLSRKDLYHNTMLWMGGAIKQPMTVNTLMNQSDLAATLLGQLRIRHTDYIFSRDIFSTEYKNPFAYFTFREGIAYIDSTGTTIHSIVQEEATSGNNEEEKRSERAKAILQTSYKDLGER